jgi:excisionase family DNA binding protein
VLPDPQDRPTLSADEAADLLGVGRSTVYRAVKSGDLPAIVLGRTVRIPTVPLLSLLGLGLTGDDGDVGDVRSSPAPRLRGVT